MKKLPCIRSIRKERGDFLVESLIGALLIGIVGVGIGHTYRKVTTTQADSQEQAIVISNMAGFAKGGQATALCAGGADTKGYSIVAGSTGCDENRISEINFNGETIEVKPAPVIEVQKVIGTGDKATTINLKVGQVIGSAPSS